MNRMCPFVEIFEGNCFQFFWCVRHDIFLCAEPGLAREWSFFTLK
jgi:hypothetical protein